MNISGKHLLLAYSSGCDSTALLTALVCIAPKYRLRLTAAHVHHGLRPESDAELLTARAQCTAFAIPCETIRLDIKGWSDSHSLGIEESARQLRYAFLEDTRQRVQADYIVTAHHGDDLTEDIIMRLLRGCGWPALGGMTGHDPKRHLLRPLLNWSKTELQQLLIQASIPWCEDPSNSQNHLTRNRIRNEIIPLLRTENPAFANAARHLWELARLDESFWEQQIAALVPQDSYLPAAILTPLHPSLRLRLYKKCLDQLGPGQTRGEQIIAMENAWTEQRERTFQFSGNKTARVTTSGIAFEVVPKR